MHPTSLHLWKALDRAGKFDAQVNWRRAFLRDLRGGER
jgi:hypothetical protein